MIADGMLGRLAKTLRMLGFDVAYDPFIADDELIRRAKGERRVLLTRDTGVVRRRGLPRHVFVASDHVGEQLAQVAQELGLRLDKDAAFTRCTVCNAELDAVTKDLVRDDVPPYVFATQERFARCRGCGRIYWRGTHVERMERTLAELIAQTPAS
jgi:uncharacterized protein with PIN domain